MPPGKNYRYNIGVIGSINRDTIYLADETHIESWGGLLYTLKFLHDSDVGDIYPVANVGKDGFNQIKTILNRFPHLKQDHIIKVDEPNNHCFLYYHNQTHKCEVLKGGVPQISYSQVKPLLSCDAILVNFISGRDVGLKTLEKLRANFPGIIYMDIHSMTLGRRKVEGGVKRFLRRPNYWKRYADCVDILQINNSEFEILSGRSFTKQAGSELFENVLSHPDCMAVTCGQDGTFLFYDRKLPKTRKIPAVTVKKVYDTTGCGDAFGAGFLSEYVKTKSYIKAGTYGNSIAAARCKIKGKVF